MSERVRIAGRRELTATVDAPDADACVVACPPHPEMGGSRSDARLRAVGDALAERGVACLRFDYGPWDEGVGERRDALDALAYARDRYGPVGLFGYSFGAAMALLAAGEGDPAVLSVLAPPASVGDGLDVRAAVETVACPLQVVYGERDATVEWEPIVERARDRGDEREGVPADHFFVGQVDTVGPLVASFLADGL